MLTAIVLTSSSLSLRARTSTRYVPTAHWKIFDPQKAGLTVPKLIAEGSSKLASVPSGGAGGAPAAGGAAGGAAPAEEAKAEEKEEEKEESDEDMGFGLFD
jgi:ribosomal protein L12E/L44/L45/RPP1/RPP2